jgi:hypothetical protein
MSEFGTITRTKAQKELAPQYHEPTTFVVRSVGRPLKFGDPVELEKLIVQYVEDCKARDMAISMSGLAYWLGTSRRALWELGKKPEYRNSISRALNWIEAHYEERLLSGRGSPIGLIFALKNNFGWVDKHEIEHSGELSITGVIAKLEGKDNPLEQEFIEGEVVDEE